MYQLAVAAAALNALDESQSFREVIDPTKVLVSKKIGLFSSCIESRAILTVFPQKYSYSANKAFD